MDREEALMMAALTRLRIKRIEQKALRRLIKLRNNSYTGNKGGGKMPEKNLAIAKETSLNVHGRMVNFIEYESDPEGDFVKVCTDDHQLGVDAEYVWFRDKYANSVRTFRMFTKICLNGQVVDCDILTIKTEYGETITVHFDISQLMEDLHNTAIESAV